MRARLLLFPLLLALAACRADAPEAEPLRVDAVGDETARRLVAEAVSAGLTGRDPGGRVVPGLAQSWRVSDDGLSIVFRLRPATFVGGRTVTARDVVETIQQARNGRAGPMARDLLQGVVSVSSPLENVVEFTLSTPQPELLELLATPPLAVRPRGRRETAGPFLAELVPPRAGQSAGETRLARNPDFFAADTVELAAATVARAEPEAAIRRFNAGATDLVLGGGLEGLGSARVTARRQSLILEEPRAQILLLVNHKRSSLGVPGVRRALQLALDRPALGRALFGTDVVAANAMLSPGNIAGYAPPRPDWADLPLPARQREALRLLAEAGHDTGERRLRLAAAIDTSPAGTRLLEQVAADLKQVGVDLSAVRRPPGLHMRAISAGDFDLALVRRDTPIDSPLPFLWPNLCGKNRHGVCLPEADRLIADSWKAPTHAERLSMLAAAERLWADDGAAIGLVQPLGWSLVSPHISGFEPNPAGTHALRHLALSPERSLLK